MDLEAEFRCATTGHAVDSGKGLVGAMQAHGLSGLSVTEKKGMIDLILRGGYSREEKVEILDYCWSDTDGLAELLPECCRRSWPGRTASRWPCCGASIAATPSPIWNTAARRWSAHVAPLAA